MFHERAFAYERPRENFTFTDHWTDLNPGVRYLVRKTTVPQVTHALVIDLTVRGVQVFTTPYAQRWQTVSEFAEKNKVVAATNGGFWNFMQRAKGMAAGKGARWPDGHDDEEVGFFAITHQNRAWISLPEVLDDDIKSTKIREAVSGEPLLVRKGVVDTPSLDAFDHANYRHPRTAVGVSADGTKVFLIVCDGRQGHSKGMTLYELARLFVELGAHMALNLDGGGSSAMFVTRPTEKGQAAGVVNSPSGGRWQAKISDKLGLNGKSTKVRINDDGEEEVYVRGVEREVMNHIGVIALTHAEYAATKTSTPVVLTPVVVVHRDHHWWEHWIQLNWKFGRLREVVYPAAYTLAAISPIILGIVWWYKRRRKKHPPRQRHDKSAD